MNMSFALTTRQFNDRSKTVTRRLGWKNMKAGQVFTGVEKGQGIKKGEKVVRLHDAECVSNRPEPLDAITQDDVIKEGFPEMTPAEFISMFCKHNKCCPWDSVNRIEFKHL